jgi:hypothetical protein
MFNGKQFRTSFTMQSGRILLTSRGEIGKVALQFGFISPAYRRKFAQLLVNGDKQRLPRASQYGLLQLRLWTNDPSFIPPTGSTIQCRPFGLRLRRMRPAPFFPFAGGPPHLTIP